MPPTSSFKVTNSSAVMAPSTNAFRPYCTPTLSRVSRLAGDPGARPQIESAHDQALQRGSAAVAVGFAGSYTALLGSSQLFVTVADWVIAPVVLLLTNRCW
jgi:hypothetical protein